MSKKKLALAVAVLGLIALLVTAGAAYAAVMASTPSRLGGGSDTVSLCKVTSHSVNASGVISSVSVTMVCSVAGTYNVTARVTSGPSYGMGVKAGQGLSPSASTFSIAISPSVTLTGSTYSVVFSISKT